MDTTDKHPPLDPNRHSTNKRVEARTDPYFGTVVREAKGAKSVSVSEKGSTSAKTLGPGETAIQRQTRVRQEAIDTQIWAQENTKQRARSDLLKRGYLTQNEALTLQTIYRKKML